MACARSMRRRARRIDAMARWVCCLTEPMLVFMAAAVVGYDPGRGLMARRAGAE